MGVEFMLFVLGECPICWSTITVISAHEKRPGKNPGLYEIKTES
jgi:hypothetical protein